MVLRGGVRLIMEPGESAKAAGLIYVTEDSKGIRRLKRGKEFHFVTSTGRKISDPIELGRIKRLAIPPAWTDVWICPSANGHLQATGRDAKGRKQHRYHARWREARDETKYNRMVVFAKALPLIRKRLEKDLKRPGLPKEKVLATVVKILETGLIRVGNEEYVKQNNSFGLTTMRDRHVKIRGNQIQFKFRGKSGKQHDIDLSDPVLAKIVKNCQDLPGQELFQYLDENGEQVRIGSTDVNQYLREITQEDFTAKDFRTWAGTVLAAMALKELEKFDSQAQAKKNLKAAIESVAERLGNTAAICRKCYIHPFVLEAYLSGNLLQAAEQRAQDVIREGLTGLRPEEAAVLAFLERRLREVNGRREGGLMKQLEASLKHRGKGLESGKGEKQKGKGGRLQKRTKKVGQSH
ncbi:MAG: DNA topoisomerase IB [Verrucomicrobiota bacterium]|nr:DNA topoisomerase IB [Verrucomicrobiota bacterium]